MKKPDIDSARKLLMVNGLRAVCARPLVASARVRAPLRWPVLVSLVAAAAVACGNAPSAPARQDVARRGEPSYAEWDRLLARYYDPARGMDYGGLKRQDASALQQLRQGLGRVAVSSLNRDQQLAYWINLYNVNVVATVVERYPIESIRDLSTDPLTRLNVFSREKVPFAGGFISLDTIENEKLREGLNDPRIHFAINCAAKSCPPMRGEAFLGARVHQQLDDQVRRFVASPAVRIAARGGRTVLHLNKVMDWFAKDFERWGGGRVAFLRRYLPPEKARLLGPEPAIEFDDYDWSLNDWRR